MTRRRTAPPVARLIGRRPLATPAARRLLQQLGFRDPGAARAVVDRLHRDEYQRHSLRGILPRLLRACGRSADPDRALVNFERLVAALPNANMLYHYLGAVPGTLDRLVVIFAHSQALADTLTRDAKFFHFLIAPEMLAAPRAPAWLDAELRRQLLPRRTAGERYDAVRRFRRRETLRIGARDLTGQATVEETVGELAHVADLCLQAVVEIAWEVVAAPYKLPGAVRATPGFAVIGMGKLGGQELNYSSDVDVLFVYAADRDLNPRLTAHEFYTKLAEEIIRAVAAPSAEGSLYRIDLRLRPEGKTGPLVRSLESCENYYAEFGETWERMALVKARPVAGDTAVGDAFLRLVQPFIYRRHTGENIIRQMAALKQRIEQEIVRDEGLTRHVKLGIGGIREIEFIVQAFQVLRGAAQPALRDRSTLRALEKLAAAGILSAAETRQLAAAYRFLRNVEHRLQLEMELQTHTIPDEDHAQYRLARSLGFATVNRFQAAQQRQTVAVREIYARVLASAEDAAAAAPAGPATPAETTVALRAAGFADPPAATKLIEKLWLGPGFGHMSQRTQDAFRRLVPVLLATARKLACPDAALAGFERFVAAYGSRGLLYELLLRNPRLPDMLLRVGDASRYLADALAHQPDLFDEICRGASLSEPKTRARMLAEVRAAAETMTAEDAARLWKRGELVRIGIEDVMGLVDLEQLHQELTRLAEVCLEFALESQAARGALAVIGLGKFGGQELGYGADLDVLFIGEDGEAAIKQATELLRFMEQQTGMGTLFAVDLRLRPDGEKGPLAGSVATHARYYRQRAQLWERQALLKARLVAGDERLGREFLTMAHEFVYAQPLTATEKQEIRRMRTRIETERGDAAHRELEFKTGPGGLVDVEFAVQTLQLEHGAAHPQLRTAHTLAALNRLMALGVVDDEAGYQLRHGYLFLRRLESVLRRVENTSISRLPADPAELGVVAKRLGIGTTEEFQALYRRVTARNRAVYTALMNQ